MKRTLVDTYAPTFDVTETRVVLVDADPAAVFGAARRLELARTVVPRLRDSGAARWSARREGGPARVGSIRPSRIREGDLGRSGGTCGRNRNHPVHDDAVRLHRPLLARKARDGLGRPRPGLGGALEAGPRDSQTVRRGPRRAAVVGLRRRPPFAPAGIEVRPGCLTAPIARATCTHRQPAGARRHPTSGVLLDGPSRIRASDRRIMSQLRRLRLLSADRRFRAVLRIPRARKCRR